uniref:Tetraspanin n=1 Tax=Alexandrium catenella TaxID=2925 RepID=A0A7S1S6U4_ALECA|mmetsp:Transcript_8866/g.24051  ORF Transcript_8866/g.24051 Transcript_8866/m.24051 type:complete len:261 (+) Transcript_8866:172-954(+)
MGKAFAGGHKLTEAIDHIVDSFDFGSRTGCALFLAVLLVVALMSAQPLFVFFQLRGNVHVEFWLGPVPIWLNLAVPICLCEMFLILLCLNCRQSPHCIKGTILCWFAANGAALVGYGIYAVAHSRMVADELTSDCGGGDFTARIQAEWDRLHAFHEDCKKREGSKDIFVQQCPGFAQMEAVPHDLYVTYIEEMESDYNCQGFCQSDKKALFNTESYEGDSCSSAVARHLREVGYEVGIPMIVIGIFAASLGVCLQQYRHL